MGNKVIWKFVLDDLESPVAVKMPAGANILTCGMSGRDYAVWAMIDTDQPIVDRRLHVVGTGWPLTTEIARMPYLGTIFVSSVFGNLVFHLFDGGETP